MSEWEWYKNFGSRAIALLSIVLSEYLGGIFVFTENGSLMAGQSVSMVKEVQPVTKIFNDLLMQIDKQLITERRNNHA